MTEDDEPIRIPISDVFDLHTVPPRDVRAVVEEYLAEAHRMGYRGLRIIHGRGIGAQREIVRDPCFPAAPFVTEFRDAPAEAGDGAPPWLRSAGWKRVRYVNNV